MTMRPKGPSFKYATAERTSAGTTDLVTADASYIFVVRGFWITTSAATSTLIQHESGDVIFKCYGAATAAVTPCYVKGAAVSKDIKVTTAGAGSCTVGINYELVPA